MNSFSDRRRLKLAYLIFQGLVFILAVFVPVLTQGDLVLTQQLIVREEVVDVASVCFLLLSSLLVFRFYEKQLDEHRGEIQRLRSLGGDLEDRLNEAFNYIGQVNVQIQEIKSLFSTLQKYPEDKEDFKNILSFLAEKVLGIVNADWVLLRIVKPDNLQTLREYAESRGAAVLLKHNVSNKELIGQGQLPEHSVVSSQPDNLTIKAFCVLPVLTLSANQRILVQAIVDQLAMLFLIFTSEYYRRNYLKPDR